MSQIYVPTTSSTPAIPTSFTVDFQLAGGSFIAPGTVVPAGNNVNINGASTNFDNVNGIQTTADPNNSKFMLVELTNRFSDTILCPASSTTTLLSFNLGGSPAGYRFNFDVVGIDTVAFSVCGYNLQSTFKTLGGVAALVQTPYIDADEDIPGNLLSMTNVGADAVLSFTNSTLNDWSVKFVGTYVVI